MTQLKTHIATSLLAVAAFPGAGFADVPDHVATAAAGSIYTAFALAIMVIAVAAVSGTD